MNDPDIIYEDEKEYKEYDVDFMENYQKQKLDDVCGIQINLFYSLKKIKLKYYDFFYSK